MRLRFSAIAAGAVVIAVIGILKLGYGPTATSREASGSASKTPWGDPDLQGIWTNEHQIPLQRPAQYANKEFFTDEEIAELDTRRAAAKSLGDRVAARGTVQDVGGAYNSVFTSRKHTGRRTSLIVDPPDGRIPPFMPEVLKRRDAMREFELALMQPTEVCKNNLRGCAGGKHGPPSPTRAETPPFYLSAGALLDGSASGAINRADGPEDRNLGERCMGAGLPDFGGGLGFFPRIVQSPGPCRFTMTRARARAGTGSSPSASARICRPRSASGGATRAAVGKAIRWSST